MGTGKGDNLAVYREGEKRETGKSTVSGAEWALAVVSRTLDDRSLKPSSMQVSEPVILWLQMFFWHAESLP